MRLTVQLKLRPTPVQANGLKRTLETANAAYDYISQVAWAGNTFHQFPIHHLTYNDVRETQRQARAALSASPEIPSASLPERRSC